MSDIAAHRLTFTPVPLPPGCVYETGVITQNTKGTNENVQFCSILQFVNSHLSIKLLTVGLIADPRTDRQIFDMPLPMPTCHLVDTRNATLYIVKKAIVTRRLITVNQILIP